MSAVIDAAADTHPVATPPRSRGPVRRQPVSMPDVALVAGLTGLAATAPLPAVLRALLVGAFVFVGPGAAFCAWVRLPRAARAAAVPTLGMSAMTLVSLTAMWSYRWSTTGILVLSALAVIAASLGHYQWRSGWPNPRTWGRTAWSVVRDTVAAPGINAATLLLFAALICWAAAISRPARRRRELLRSVVQWARHPVDPGDGADHGRLRRGDGERAHRGRRRSRRGRHRGGPGDHLAGHRDPGLRLDVQASRRGRLHPGP
ncbi:hypothetical protein K8O93_12380 [Gordonia bronchialis]|nr:hypothetical protein K8O93_12380 [Gordonia bronchialis]